MYSLDKCFLISCCVRSCPRMRHDKFSVQLHQVMINLLSSHIHSLNMYHYVQGTGTGIIHY